MGGGGGYFGGSYTPDRYKEIIDETREKTRDAGFEASVNDMINDRLSGCYRDSETTREHLDDIKDAIEEEEIGAIDLRFGGSVKKHTYVDGLSDVDVLVIINRTELSNASPQEILNYIKNRIEESHIRNVENVKIGKLAVTVTFSDGEEIQLLPAIKRNEGYKIPGQEGKNWSKVIRPDKFASKLTDVNQKCGGKVIPVIKLVKGIMSQIPEDQQLSGYHIESAAIEIFKSYPESEPRKTKTMLSYFFEHAKDVVKKPIKDKTNQSIHVDDDLGSENSPQRMRVSYSLDRMVRRMKNADEVGSIEEWESILGDE